MFCKNCGEPIAERAHFCARCGAPSGPLASPPPPQQYPAPPINQPTPFQQPSPGPPYAQPPHPPGPPVPAKPPNLFARMSGGQFGCLSLALMGTMALLGGGGAGIAFQNGMPIVGIPLMLLSVVIFGVWLAMWIARVGKSTRR